MKVLEKEHFLHRKKLSLTIDKEANEGEHVPVVRCTTLYIGCTYNVLRQLVSTGREIVRTDTRHDGVADEGEF